MLLDEQRDNFRRPRRGQLPVGLEVAVVNGDIVGVAFHADVKSLRVQHLGDASQSILASGQQGGISAVEEAYFAQADHQTFRRDPHLDFVLLDFLAQGLLQFMPEFIHVGRAEATAGNAGAGVVDRRGDGAGSGKTTGAWLAEPHGWVAGVSGESAQLLKSPLDGGGDLGNFLVIDLRQKRKAPRKRRRAG